MAKNENIEYVDHEIKIDEFVEVRLKIPKVMDAIDLKALTMKANKLFNLSDTDSISKNGYTKRTYTKRALGKNNVGRKSIYSDALLDDFVQLRKDGVPYRKIREKLNRKHRVNFSLKQYMSKGKNINNRIIVSEKTTNDKLDVKKQKRTELFPQNIIDAIITLKSSTNRYSFRQIAEKLNRDFLTKYSMQQVKDKTKALRAKGLL